MQVDIVASPAFAFATVTIPPGGDLLVEAGAMASMTDGVDVETKARGGVLSGLKRSVLGGTTFFINTFRAANGGEVGVAPDLPGDIAVIPVDASQPVLVQSGSWLAGDSSVDVDTKWGGSKTFFSGKGLFLLRCTGAGDILAASYGAILARTLAAGRDASPSTPASWSRSTRACSTTCTRPATGRPRSSAARASSRSSPARAGCGCRPAARRT